MHRTYLWQRNLPIFILLLTCVFLNAQDIIQQKDGKQIRARVVSLDKTTLVYKNFDDPEFISHSIPKKDLKKIVYENGKVVDFGLQLPRSYVAFSMGSAIPLGGLRATSQNDTKYSAGYMTGGLFARIDAGVYFRKNFGMALQFGGMNFKMNKQAYIDDLSNDVDTEDPPLDLRYYDRDDSSEESKRMNFNVLNIGLLYSPEVGEKHTVDFRVMTGILKTGTAMLQEVKVFYPEDSVRKTTVYREFDIPSRISLVLGAAYRYSISAHWAIRANVDWYSSALKRSYNIRTDGKGATISNQGVNTDVIRFRSLHIGVGIVYQFNRKNS